MPTRIRLMDLINYSIELVKFQNLYEIVVNKIAMYMKPFLTLVIHFRS